MLPERQLSRVIPACLVRALLMHFVDRRHQGAIYIDVHVSIAWTALVDETEGLARKLERDRGAIFRCLRKRSSDCRCLDLLCPIGRVDKGTVFVVIDCLWW